MNDKRTILVRIGAVFDSAFMAVFVFGPLIAGLVAIVFMRIGFLPKLLIAFLTLCWACSGLMAYIHSKMERSGRSSSSSRRAAIAFGNLCVAIVVPVFVFIFIGFLIYYFATMD